MAKGNRKPKLSIYGKQEAVSTPGNRPTKLEIDPDLKKRILDACRMGAHVTVAAAFIGVSYSTMRNWVVHGHNDPNSEYAALLRDIEQAIAQWEMRDLSVIEAHSVGRPAKYLMEPVVVDGKPVLDPKGEVLMRPMLDGEGRPILQQSEIRSDWRAAMERLARRMPRNWARRDQLSVTTAPDPVLTFELQENPKEEKEVLTLEQQIEIAAKKFKEEYG